MNVLTNPYLELALGLAVVMAGAHWLVHCASILADRWRVSSLVVGLTVVSLGTSLPETVVSGMASASGQGDVAISNILGSNIANILLVLGIAATVRPLQLRDPSVLSRNATGIGITLAVGLLAALGWYKKPFVLNSVDGIILASLSLAFVVCAHRETARPPNPCVGHGRQGARAAGPLIGLPAAAAALAVGADTTVHGTLAIAQHVGLSASTVALTLTALGTSLPEVLVSAVAAWRSNAGIAIGNALGSNVFNLTWVLGVSAWFGEIEMNPSSYRDLGVLLGCTLTLHAILVRQTGASINRSYGLAMVATYAAYVGLMVGGA